MERALVNFALLHLFGYQFAPRYKAIQEKLRTSLYGFEHPTQYGDVLLKPVRKIHTDLIVEEWENLVVWLVSSPKQWGYASEVKMGEDMRQPLN